MMNRIKPLMGVAILAVLVGCAKQEAQPAQAVDEPDEGTATIAVVPSEPSATKPMPISRSKAAADMIAFIDPSPQCQQYRDQIEALGRTQGPIDDLSPSYIAAYKAGCVIKKQQ